MIKIENTQVVGWEPAIRGMRNPKNSWDRMDSKDDGLYVGIGPNDHKLMMSLANGGPVHAKYRRYIDVYVDITAPLYWWKEFDTYRTAFAPNPFDIEENSCSTMHKIDAKEFERDDFSWDHMLVDDLIEEPEDSLVSLPVHVLDITIATLNHYRKKFIEADKKVKEYIKRHNVEMSELRRLKEIRKKYWWQIIQLLPSSYNQKRTVKLTYETCAAIHPDRKNHKQDEWRELCKWIESLPYSEIVIGEK